MRLTRRKCFALAAATISTACRRGPVGGFPGYALIATSGENSLAVLDLDHFRLLKKIALDAPPTAVVPGPGQRRNYVLTPSSGSVHVVDQSLHLIKSARLGDELSEIRLSADGKMLIAISSTERKLLFADASALKPFGVVNLDDIPVAMDISAEGFVAVSLGGAGGVLLFQPGGQVLGRHSGEDSGSVRFRLDGKLLIVSRPKTKALSMLTVPGLQVLAELPLAMRPQHLCFTPDGGQLFVTGEGMDAVAIVFPYNALEVEQTILAGRDPGVMACCDDPELLFVGDEQGSDLSILDVESRKVLALVEVGTNPRYIAVTPDAQYALVVDEGSGDVAVLRIPAIHSSQGKKNGAALFTLIPVGEKPVHAAIITKA